MSRVQGLCLGAWGRAEGEQEAELRCVAQEAADALNQARKKESREGVCVCIATSPRSSMGISSRLAHSKSSAPDDSVPLAALPCAPLFIQSLGFARLREQNVTEPQ